MKVLDNADKGTHVKIREEDFYLKTYYNPNSKSITDNDVLAIKYDPTKYEESELDQYLFPHKKINKELL